MAKPQHSVVFGFSNVLLLKGQLLGNGAYGMVYKAQCDDLLCAAKVLHPLLVVSETNIRSLEQECQRLCTLRHPNVVQYLGTHVDGPNSLAILMELMERNLSTFLDESPSSSLPFHTQINLCHDLTLALSYLHANDVVHGNLSSNNVLLSPGPKAKVTDFGMSRLVSLSTSAGNGGNSGYESSLSRALTRGHLAAYMSPESLSDPPTFSKKLDIFSFGVLALQILTRKFPNPGPPRRKIDSRDYGMPVEVAVPEIERRKAHIELVDPAHPLLRTVTLCLAYAEGERPGAQDLCAQTAHLKASEQYLSSVEKGSCATGGDGGPQSRAEAKDEELSRVSEQLLSAELLKNDLQMQLLEKEMEVLNARQEKKTMEEAVDDLRCKLEAKEKELLVSEETRRQLLDAKDDELRALDESRRELYGHLRVKEEELKASEESRREIHMQLGVKEEELRGAQDSKRELQKELLAVYKQLKKVQEDYEGLKMKQNVGAGDQTKAEDDSNAGITQDTHLETLVKAIENEVASSSVTVPSSPPLYLPTPPPIAQTSNGIHSVEVSAGATDGSKRPLPPLPPPPPRSSSRSSGKDISLTIALDKGPSGSLGIGITGGVDSPYYVGNTGIFITKVVPDGVAGRDGRLRKNDQILSINGTILKNITHLEAVNIMKEAGQHVTLVIVRSEDSETTPSNGSAQVAAADVVDLTLQKNAKGEYGFNISGGSDNQYVLGDNGIFITKIIPRGPAEDCGVLDVGDRIIEVDGKSLANVPYGQAESILKTAPERMSLKIEKNAIRNPEACITNEPRTVALNCPEGHSLGISLFGCDKDTGVYISAITLDSVAAKSGLLRVGDQILEVNHNDLRRAALKDAVPILEHAGTTVSLLVEYRPDDISDILNRISQNETNASTGLVSRPPLKVEQIFVRALFNFDAASDEKRPPDALSFRQGDILHILNGSGDVWWRASVVNNQGMDIQEGKIPSRKQIISAANRRTSRSPTPPSPRSEKKAAKKAKSKQKGSVLSLAVDPPPDEQRSMDEYVPTYVPVQKGQSGRTHPIIILGPLKNELIENLVRDFPNDYAQSVQYTTRPRKEREVDGANYHFVSKDEMEKNIQKQMFIEVGRYDGYLYGTSIAAVRAVIEQGKYCILDVSGYAITYLQSAGLYPVTICIKPHSWNVVREVTHETEQECRSIIKRGETTEQEFINYISAVVTGRSMSELYSGLKSVIRDRSGGPVWILTDDLLL